MNITKIKAAFLTTIRASWASIQWLSMVLVATAKVARKTPLIKPIYEFLESKKWLLFFANVAVIYSAWHYEQLGTERAVTLFVVISCVMLIAQGLCDRGRDAGKHIANLYGKFSR